MKRLDYLKCKLPASNYHFEGCADIYKDNKLLLCCTMRNSPIWFK